jgi:hypothetical protein
MQLDWFQVVITTKRLFLFQSRGWARQPPERRLRHPSRSGNWTCGFPAAGSPTGFIAGPTDGRPVARSTNAALPARPRSPGSPEHERPAHGASVSKKDEHAPQHGSPPYATPAFDCRDRSSLVNHRERPGQQGAQGSNRGGFSQRPGLRSNPFGCRASSCAPAAWSA